MVRELFVRDGRYVNLFPKHGWENYLATVDTPNLEGSKKHSAIAKKKALKLAKLFEKKGYKQVVIFAKYSYGNPYPYRYEVNDWGGGTYKPGELK